MLIPHSDFPARPKPVKGESLCGYINRFYGTNGHTVPINIRSALHQLYRGHVRNMATVFERVRKVLVADVRLDREWWLGREVIRSDENRWSIVSLPTYHYGAPKLCPHCVTEYGFHLVLWDLPLVDVCPVHGCVLQTNCSSCNEEFNWEWLAFNLRCSCGSHISETIALPGKPWLHIAAQFVAGSFDVELPEGYEVSVLDSNLRAYSLQEFYGAFEQLCEIRNLLRQVSDKKVPRVQRNLPLVGHGSWEAHFLAASSEELYRRLCGALSRLARSEGSLFVHLAEDSPLMKAKKKISEQFGELSPFREKFELVVQKVIENHRFGTPRSFLILVDPRIQPELKKYRMNEFAQWWFRLVSTMAPWNSKAQLVSGNDNVANEFGSQLANKQAPEILKALQGAAQRKCEIEDFEALAYWWRVPDFLRDHTQSQNILHMLASYLASISWSELNFVYEIVMMCAKKADQNDGS